jgi:hypothetical protein
MRSNPPLQGAASQSNGEPLLVDLAGLSGLVRLSVRHLRRLDASGDIPGRVTSGRRVLFQLDLIREWVRAGMPDRAHWLRTHKHTTNH